MLAAATTISSCSDASELVTPIAPTWGVGGELVYDSYSVDTSGFWRIEPDSTVRYRFVSDSAAIDGRTNVRVFLSGRDSLLIAHKANGDAELFLNRFNNPLIPLPRLWAPLPYVSKRDATFLSIDSTIGAGQLTLRIKGDAVSHYGGNEEYSAPGLDRMTTARNDVVATGSASATGISVANLDFEGTIWFVPAIDIISRSDTKMSVLTAVNPDKNTTGVSLRLKSIVYPN